jgi:hypothetical protein
MSGRGSVTTDWSSAQYRRHARRLRKLYADEPARLHHHLSDLSCRHDRWHESRASQENRARTGRSTSIRPAHPQASFISVREEPQRDAMAHFTEAVRGAMDDRILRYSRRIELLRLAKRLGIERFHASLAIALVQHQVDAQETFDSVGQPSTAAGRHFEISATTDQGASRAGARRTSFALMFTMVAVVQALIVFGAWRVIHP